MINNSKHKSMPAAEVENREVGAADDNEVIRVSDVKEAGEDFAEVREVVDVDEGRVDFGDLSEVNVEGRCSDDIEGDTLGTNSTRDLEEEDEER